MQEDRKQRFQELLNETREDINRIESNIERELAEVKERLAVLQNEKKAQLTIYSGYCQLLGVPNDMEAEEEDDDDF